MTEPDFFERATIFTPGRASYVEQEKTGEFVLKLSEASRKRALVATSIFSSDIHDKVLFAGGYPGVAEKWPVEQIPAHDNREAHLMAKLFTDSIGDDVGNMVETQGDSTNSFGDVIVSIRNGLLDPNDFHNAVQPRRIDLVTGTLHGLRFKMILQKALDLDRASINRVNMTDIYGRPATEFRKKETQSAAVAKEIAAIALTAGLLKNVRDGDLDGVQDAEDRFLKIVK